MRGFAIGSVFLFHSLGSAFGRFHLPWNGNFPTVYPFNSFLFFSPLSLGFLGVPIFFVVSGFCIHLSYVSNRQDGWGHFFKKRFTRIYPAYLLAVVLFFATPLKMYPISENTKWFDLLCHVFMVHNLNSETCFKINPSFWSIAIEMQLYLLYPLLFSLVKIQGWRRTLIQVGLIEIFFRLFLPMISNNYQIEVPQFFHMSPFSFWFSWSIGAYISDCWIHKRVNKFCKLKLKWFLFLTLATACFRPLSVLTFTLAALSTGVFLSHYLKTGIQKSKIIEMMGRHLMFLGTVSYSFYLFHQPVVHLSYRISKVVFPNLFFPSAVMFMMMLFWYPVILACSYCVYKWIEVPFSKMKATVPSGVQILKSF